MVGESETIHDRSTISEQTGPTAQSSLFQGHSIIESIRSMLFFKIFDEYAKKSLFLTKNEILKSNG
jgi:hypothetical protein